MKKSTIISVVILFILVGVLVVVFVIIEKPKQDISGKYSKLNILALDESGNQRVLDYDVFVNGDFYSSGKTLRSGAILESVPVNLSFRVIGYPSENNSYYAHVTEDVLAQDIPYRVTLKPKKAGKLFIFHGGDFSTFNELFIEFKSTGLWKDLGFCIKWSERILFVRVENYTQSEKPELYKNYDKCYLTEQTLNETESLSIVINYEKFGELSETDFINIIGYDFDNRNNELVVSYDGIDVGGKNVLYEVKR